MDVESLVIQLGIDSSALKDAVHKMQSELDALKAKVEAGAKAMSNGMDNVAQGANRAGDAATSAGQKAANMGNQFAASLRSFAMGLVAPIAGMMSFGAMIQGYTSDVAKAAQITGVFNSKLEEERKKKELLSRVTKEDLELYKKSVLAMDKLEYALHSVGNVFMRQFNPFVEKGAQTLQKIADWVNANQNNIVRFFTVVAGVITAVMLPAILRMTAAMLANPITWLVVLLAGLALVIDDLIVYIQGGESAFADFWSMFGTGEEIGKKLKAVWETVKDVWDKNKKSVAAFFAALAGFKVLQTVIGLVSRFAKGIQTLTSVILRNPLMIFIVVLADFIAYITTGSSMLDGFWKKFGKGEEILTKLKSLWDTLYPVIAKNVDVIIAAAAAFAGFNIIKGAVSGVMSLVGAFKALNVAMLANPWILLLSVIIGVIVYVIQNWDQLKQKWDEVCEAISQKIDTFVQKWNQSWENLKNLIKNTWDNIISTITNAVMSVVNAVQNAWDNIKNAATNAWEGVKNLISNAFNAIVSGIASFASALLSSLQNTWNSVINAATAVWNTLIQTVQNVWDSIVNSISSFGSNLLSGVQNAWNSVLDFFNSLNLFESGQKLLSTFIDGIKAKVGALVDAVKGAFGKVREYLPFSDAHVGPLSQLTVSGSKMLSTFGEGVEQGESGLLDTVGKAFSSVKDIFANVFGDKKEQKTLEPARQSLNTPIVDEGLNREPSITSPEKIVLEGPQITAEAPSVRVEQPEAVRVPQQAITPAPPVQLPLPIFNPAQQVQLPAPEISQAAMELPAPKTGWIDSVVSAIDALSSEVGGAVSSAVTGALDGLTSFAESMKAIMIPQGPQLAMAGIAPSITENDNSRATTTTVTTNISGVTVNTQATDAQGVANALPSAMRNTFNRAGTNASISGVRQ